MFELVSWLVVVWLVVDELVVATLPEPVSVLVVVDVSLFVLLPELDEVFVAVVELSEPPEPALVGVGIVGVEPLVVPAVEFACDVRDPMLEPLRARVPDVREPFRQHRLGVARERAHRSVQLPGEALCSILPRGLHELREPLSGLVRV